MLQRTLKEARQDVHHKGFDRRVPAWDKTSQQQQWRCLDGMAAKHANVLKHSCKPTCRVVRVSGGRWIAIGGESDRL